jgi:hypothetical protein
MERGGVLLRASAAHYYIPASVAVAVTPRPIVAPVPGAPEGLAGVAFCEGTIVPVISIGPARDTMVLCAAAGELVGVIGAESVESLVLDDAAGTPASVERDNVRYQLLDVPAMCETLQSEMSRSAWAG